MIRLDLALDLACALLLPALGALGCAGAPLPPPTAAPIAASSASAPVIVAAPTVAAPTVAAATTSAPAALPAGWTAGAPAPLEAAKAPASPTLDAGAPEALRLADLPLVEVTPIPSDKHRPSVKTRTPGEPSREILITPGCKRASVRNHAFGFIQVGWVVQPIAAQSGGGVELWHVKGGDGRERYTVALWATLDRGEDGALHFQETDAWFDMLDCKAYEVRHVDAAPRPIAGGLAYAFRTHCASCTGAEVDQLHLITPGSDGADTGSFDHREIPLGPGLSKTLSLHLSADSIRRFRQGGALTTRTTDAKLGLDVTQGTGEAEPTAVVYVNDAPPPRF